MPVSAPSSLGAPLLATDPQHEPQRAAGVGTAGIGEGDLAHQGPHRRRAAPTSPTPVFRRRGPVRLPVAVGAGVCLPWLACHQAGAHGAEARLETKLRPAAHRGCLAAVGVPRGDLVRREPAGRACSPADAEARPQPPRSRRSHEGSRHHEGHARRSRPRCRARWRSRAGSERPPPRPRWCACMRLTGDLTPKSVVASPAGPRRRPEHDVHATRSRRSVPTAPCSRRSRTPSTSRSSGSRGTPARPRGPRRGRLHQGRQHAWVSNYSMYGAGYGPEGLDSCTHGRRHVAEHRLPGRHHDVRDRPGRRRSGAVPKYVAVTPGRQDGPRHQLVLVGPVASSTSPRTRRWPGSRSAASTRAASSSPPTAAPRTSR